MISKKRFLKVDETLDYICSLEEKGARKNELIGFRSIESCKEFKHIISICTSISVILLQYDLSHICLSVLKKASLNDEKLLKYGSASDKLWIGRLLIFTNLAFAYLKLGSFSESLKFIYESQCYLLTLSESGVPIHEDYKVGTELLTFSILWLHGKVKEASGYLDSAARSVNIIIKGTPTKLNKNDIQNLYGIIVCALAAISVKLGGDVNKSVELCEKCLKEFQGESTICGLIKHAILCIKNKDMPLSLRDIDFIPCTKDFNDRNYKFPDINEDFLNNPLPNEENWLVGHTFLRLLLESAFFPIISPNTPALKKEDLEFERAKIKLLDTIEDNNVKETKRQSNSVTRKDSAMNSPKRATASVLKSRRASVPWWQNHQFIDKVFKNSVNEARDHSALRQTHKKIKEIQNFPSIDSQIHEIYTSRLSPRRSKLKKREKKSKNEEVEGNSFAQEESRKVSSSLIPINQSRNTKLY